MSFAKGDYRYDFEIACPYNLNHKMPYSKLVYHLNRGCKDQREKGHLFQQCQYNTLHIIRTELMAHHLKTCLHKKKDRPLDPQLQDDIVLPIPSPTLRPWPSKGSSTPTPPTSTTPRNTPQREKTKKTPPNSPKTKCPSGKTSSSKYRRRRPKNNLRRRPTNNKSCRSSMTSASSTNPSTTAIPAVATTTPTTTIAKGIGLLFNKQLFIRKYRN